jgi:hypothetical protein
LAGSHARRHHQRYGRITLIHWESEIIALPVFMEKINDYTISNHN